MVFFKYLKTLIIKTDKSFCVKFYIDTYLMLNECALKCRYSAAFLAVLFNLFCQICYKNYMVSTYVNIIYYFFSQTYPVPSIQPKVLNRYVVQQVPDPSQCEGSKVCCQLSFVDDDTSGNQYPVATPPPEPYYPIPPRFPEKVKPPPVCGIRRAYGIQGRLKQLQYSPDVSEFGEYPWQVSFIDFLQVLNVFW